jgi:hypothetical protein
MLVNRIIDYKRLVDFFVSTIWLRLALSLALALKLSLLRPWRFAFIVLGVLVLILILLLYNVKILQIFSNIYFLGFEKTHGSLDFSRLLPLTIWQFT